MSIQAYDLSLEIGIHTSTQSADINDELTIYQIKSKKIKWKFDWCEISNHHDTFSNKITNNRNQNKYVTIQAIWFTVYSDRNIYKKYWSSLLSSKSTIRSM